MKRGTRSGLGATLGFLVAAACGSDPAGPAPCTPSTVTLGVGGVTVLDQRCLVLPNTPGAQYLVIPFTANFDRGSTNHVMTLNGSPVTLAAANRTDRRATSYADAVHTRLRSFEGRLAARGPSPRIAAGPRLAQVVGEIDSFWVIQAVDELDRVLENPQPGDFDRVYARLKFVGDNTLVYEDTLRPAGGLSDAELEEIGQLFDDILYPLDVNVFGEPSDVNGDNTITVLLSPSVNRLTPAEDVESGFIAGFFFPLDLFEPNSPQCPFPGCDFSNQREIFYGIVADPQGTFGIEHSRENVQRTVPPIMTHEFQHMISFNQRNIVLGSPRVERLWLSEALAHLAEELGGDALLGDPREDDFHLQNLLRAARFLEEPWMTNVTDTAGGGTLEERGAGWLFVRWLGEQYGTDIFRTLTQTRDRGVTNVQNRTGADFHDLFGDFMITVYTDDLSIPNLSNRYQIPKWFLRDTLVVGGAYALQPDAVTFGELSAGSITQTLSSASPYHVLADDDGSGPLEIQVQFGGNPSLGIAIVRTN